MIAAMPVSPGAPCGWQLTLDMSTVAAASCANAEPAGASRHKASAAPKTRTPSRREADMARTLTGLAHRASRGKPLLASACVAAARAGVILAAGASRRMGQPKALLPWRGSTLVEHAVQQARLAGTEHLVVVVGPATRDLHLDAATTFNPSPESGRSTSIRLGAERLPEAAGAILVQSVDQPVEAEVIVALFTAVEAGAAVAVPSFGGRRGHPVCVSGSLLSELRTVAEEDQGLRAVVRRHPPTEVPVASESVIWNLNDPAAYQ